MAVPAGSKGGFFGPLWDTGLTLETFVERLDEIAVARDLLTVRTLGLYVNDVCNLGCEHCYYRLPNGYARHSTLSADALIDRLQTLPSTGVRLCAFVGKEVLVPGQNGMEKTISVMRALRSLAPGGGPEWIGAVTNGVFLDRALGPFAEIELDFLDVSFDGPDSETHDQLRGRGSFERSFRNLELAVRARVARKIFVATTLWAGNLETLGDVLCFERHLGVRHFSIMPVVAIHNDEHAISLDELVRFLSHTLPAAVERIQPSEPVQVVVDLDSYVISRKIDAFSALFSGATVALDQLNNILVRTECAGIDLVVRISLPDPCNSYGCLTHEGLYFDKGGCLFMREGYAEHALGDSALTPLTELVASHRAAAENAVTRTAVGNGRALFSFSSPQLLGDLEETGFYAIPEMA